MELSNINYVKKVLYKEQMNDHVDDSFDDRDFELKDIDQESLDSLSSTDFLKGQVNDTSGEQSHFQNPFESDSSESEGLNSVIINPYDSSGSSDCDDDRPLQVPRTSSPVNPMLQNGHQCQNCDKSFQSKYNLKMHNIQFHRIFLLYIKLVYL